MRGAIPPLPQYVFMAWCSVKTQGQIYPYIIHYRVLRRKFGLQEEGTGGRFENTA
jgi:hypothetical protein